MKDIPAKF